MFLQIPCSRNQKQDLVIQYNSVSSEIGKASGSGKKKKKYISQERHGIGKYDAEHSNNAAINKKKALSMPLTQTIMLNLKTELLKNVVQRKY